MDKVITFQTLLKSKDMSMSRLARILGVTPRTVMNWAKGVTTPSFKQIERIAEVIQESFETVVAVLRNSR